MTVLFHFELCPQGSFICSVWQDFLPFCVYSLCAYTIFCLSFHLLMTIWVTFTSGLLWIVMKWTWECKDLFQTLFSFLSGVYSEVGLLDHMTAGSIFNFLRNFILFCLAVKPLKNPIHICSAFEFFYFARWLIMLSIFSYAHHLFGCCVCLFSFLGQFSVLLLLLIWGSSLYILGKNSLWFIYIADVSPIVLIAFMLS